MAQEAPREAALRATHGATREAVQEVDREEAPGAREGDRPEAQEEALGIQDEGRPEAQVEGQEVAQEGLEEVQVVRPERWFRMIVYWPC